MNEERLLTIIQEDGTEMLCEILFTHFSEEFGKNYVVFNPQGTSDLVPAVYTPEDTDGILKPIETDEEEEMLLEVLEAYMEEHKDEFDIEDDCGCGDGCGCGDDDGCSSDNGGGCCGGCNH